MYMGAMVGCQGRVAMLRIKSFQLNIYKCYDIITYSFLFFSINVGDNVIVLMLYRCHVKVTIWVAIKAEKLKPFQTRVCVIEKCKD